MTNEITSLKELERVIECNDRHCGVTDKYTVVIKGTVLCRNHKALTQFRAGLKDFRCDCFGGHTCGVQEFRRRILG